MGEAARRADAPRETFAPGIITVRPAPGKPGTMYWMDKNGMLYALTRGRRIMDPKTVAAAQEAAREAGMSSSKIIRPSGIIKPGQ